LAKEGTFELQEHGDGELELSVSGNGASWELDFVAPEKQQLAPRSYSKAARPPFQDPGQPGFSFSGEGRGCNTVRSSFVIQKLTRDKNNRVTELDAEFSQRCDDSPKELRGQLRYRARAP
jgi:hypothetical protein